MNIPSASIVSNKTSIVRVSDMLLFAFGDAERVTWPDVIVCFYIATRQVTSRCIISPRQALAFDIHRMVDWYPQ